MRSQLHRSRRIVLAALALALMMPPVQPVLYAQVGVPTPVVPTAYGTPSEFVVTVNECSISMDGGSSYPVQLFNTPVSFDVASGATGATIETLVNNATVPAGTYDSMRCTVDATVQFTAEITVVGPVSPIGVLAATPGTYYTGAPTIGGFPSATTTGPATSIMLTDPDGDFQFTQAINLTVAAGLPQTVRVDFTLEQAVQLYEVLSGDGIFVPANGAAPYFILLPNTGNGLTVTITVVGPN